MINITKNNATPRNAYGDERLTTSLSGLGERINGLKMNLECPVSNASILNSDRVVPAHYVCFLLAERCFIRWIESMFLLGR